ncbi:MAG: hypothetical protein STSR0008_24200 [Ignavibacterium sp.]
MEGKKKKEKVDDKENKLQKEQTIIICPFCGKATPIIWVHGHSQCQFCHSIIDECCMGDGLYFNNTSKNNSTKSNSTK